MNVETTEIEGLLLITPKVHHDRRGTFVKTYHDRTYAELNLPRGFAEEFFSTSRQGVVRGMHCQIPPANYHLMVTCVAGHVLDVVLDLRRRSLTYRKAKGHRLSSETGQMLFVPTGCAHGFLTLSDEATMFYRTSALHSPPHDLGVRFDSFGWDWGINEPILSDRDLSLPSLSEFDSPF